MKKIILLSAVFFTVQSFSQEPYYDFKKFRDKMNGGKYLSIDSVEERGIMSRDSLETILKHLQQHQQYTQAFGDLAFSYPRGTRVLILPPDNMPCIVPDLSQFNMPNVGLGIKITGMPPTFPPPVPIIPPQNK